MRPFENPGDGRKSPGCYEGRGRKARRFYTTVMHNGGRAGYADGFKKERSLSAISFDKIKGDACRYRQNNAGKTTTATQIYSAICGWRYQINQLQGIGDVACREGLFLPSSYKVYPAIPARKECDKKVKAFACFTWNIVTKRILFHVKLRNVAPDMPHDGHYRRRCHPGHPR